MIIRCPSCTTRFELPASRFDADGTMIKCSVCGHDWIEARAVEILREPASQLPKPTDARFEPDSEIRRLVDASKEAYEAFAAKRKQRRMLFAAWIGLMLVGASPVALAIGFPDKVAQVMPATVPLLERMGSKINIYGLDIRKVEMQHLVVEGKRIISIKGEIANLTSSPRKIPWLRFGLNDASNSEIYTWQLDTNARPLNPGESTSFMTRIASPPETAGTVQIRFARADEIELPVSHD